MEKSSKIETEEYNEEGFRYNDLNDDDDGCMEDDYSENSFP